MSHLFITNLAGRVFSKHVFFYAASYLKSLPARQNGRHQRVTLNLRETGRPVRHKMYLVSSRYC